MFSHARARSLHNTYSTDECEPSTLWDRETDTLKQRCSSSSVFERNFVESDQIAKSAKFRHGRDEDEHRGLLVFYFDRCTASPAPLPSISLDQGVLKILQSELSCTVTIQLEAGAFGTLFQAPSFIQSQRSSASICRSSRNGVPTSSVD
jgi:hypothetical protein